jgi:hypothetical protein
VVRTQHKPIPAGTREKGKGRRYLSTVLNLSPYPWDCAALQFRRNIELRPGNAQARALANGVVKSALRRTGPRQRVNMQRSKPSAYRAFRAATHTVSLPWNVRTTAPSPPSPFHAAAHVGPLLPLVPYQRCTCGSCRGCRDNAKWDRIFAKFEVKECREVRGVFRCALEDL